jgi:hypothetical protein
MRWRTTYPEPQTLDHKPYLECFAAVLQDGDAEAVGHGAGALA